MADIKPPILVKPISDIMLNAGSDLYIDLRNHIHSPNETSGDIRFVVTLDDGEPLPAGLRCSPAGELVGKVNNDAVNAEAYRLLIVAKNAADVPLISEVNLNVLDAPLLDESEDDFTDESVDKNVFDEEPERAEEDPREEVLSDDSELFADELEEFFDDDLDEVAKAEMDHIRDFAPERLGESEYQERFIEYMLRRYSSLQIYNAEFEGEMIVEAPTIETAKSGWKIHHDGDFSLSTSNPDVYDTYLNRGKFIETVQEMVENAATKGWKTLGVAGFDKNVGLHLIHQHNRRESQKPTAEQRTFEFDDIFQDTQWIDEMINNMPPRPGSE